MYSVNFFLIDNPCQTSTPIKETNHNEKTLNITPVQTLSKKDLDAKFFRNLLTINQASKRKISLKNRITVIDELDETVTKGILVLVVFMNKTVHCFFFFLIYL